MSRLYSAALAGLMLPLAAACTSTEDMTLLHREITDVQRQVQQLEQSMPDRGDLDKMEQRLQDLTSQTMRSNADLAMRVERLQEQIEALHASLELTTRRLQTISQELAAARAALATGAVLPPVTAAPAAGGEPNSSDDGAQTGGSEPSAVAAVPLATATPEQLYRSSYEDYMRGNYDLAAQGFREYLKRWQDTDLADNALYWIGECHDAQEETQQALDVFTQVLEEYPTSDKAAAAQLKKGLLYLKLGDKGQGVLNLQYVVYEHPGTKEADLARERLRSMGLTIR
jgi:tol-pal system protein YbgF